MADPNVSVKDLADTWRARAAEGDQSATAEQQDVGYQMGLENCADELEAALANIGLADTFRCVECDDDYRVGTPCDCRVQPGVEGFIPTPRQGGSVDINPLTTAGLNNTCSNMHLKDGTGACDGLYELAVKHGAPEREAAGYAHNINNAMIALHETALFRGRNQE